MNIEDKLKKYMTSKYPDDNIVTLLNMIKNLVEENDDLKERVAILEQILHMHLPIIEK